MGLVPQGRRVFPTLSVEENLLVAERSIDRHGWNCQRVYALFPRLQERRNQRAKTLSGGEQQMLAIGRALMTNPDCLIMDEPSEGLAPIIIQSLWEAIGKLKQQGLSISARGAERASRPQARGLRPCYEQGPSGLFRPPGRAGGERRDQIPLLRHLGSYLLSEELTRGCCGAGSRCCCPVGLAPPAEMPRSAIREIMVLAAARPNIIHLEVGEPDFSTPLPIIDAAFEAARSGFTKYSPNAGLTSLRERVAKHVSNTWGKAIPAERVIITTGAIGALYSAHHVGNRCRAMKCSFPIRAGRTTKRSCISPAPVPSALFAARSVDLCPTRSRSRLVTPRTKAIVINSPCNPTGAVFSACPDGGHL